MCILCLRTKTHRLINKSCKKQILYPQYLPYSTRQNKMIDLLSTANLINLQGHYLYLKMRQTN